MGLFEYFSFEARLMRKKERLRAQALEREAEYIRTRPTRLEQARLREAREQEQAMRDYERIRPLVEGMDLEPMMQVALAMNGSISQIRKELPEIMDRELPGWRRRPTLDEQLDRWEAEQRWQHRNRGSSY